MRGSNDVSLLHAEVIAVKEAFVKALSRNGVDGDKMAAIRRELGLGADSAMDRDAKRPAFDLVVGEARTRRTRPNNTGGAISVAYSSEFRPAALRIGNQTHSLGPKDRFQVTFECNFLAHELRRIEQMDLAPLDLSLAEETFNRNPPEAHHLRLTEKLIPEKRPLSFDLRSDLLSTIA